VKRLPRDTCGATAIEYCMVACMISIVIAGIIPEITAKLEVMYTSILSGFE